LARVIETDLYATINFQRAVVCGFMRQKRGRMVNIASMSGQAGLPGQMNYSASKAGIIGLAKALAKEVAKYGVTVNAVFPGHMATDMLRDMSEQYRDQMVGKISMRRIGQCHEVANVVKFLLSEDAFYIAGQVSTVDGGLYI
jgi:3-oxoacyl-[acyl-carrier protein] reductase